MESTINGRGIRPVAFFTLFIITSTAPASVYGQIWTDYNEHDPGIIAVEVMIPSFDNALNVEAPSSALELYARFPVAENISLIASLPISHYEATGSFLGGDVSETALGNPYLGARFGSERSGDFNFEFGARVPVASVNDTGLLTGQLIENHVLGRFLTETVTLTGMVRYQRDQESGIVLRAGGGPDVWIPTEGGPATELVITYYGQILYRSEALTVGAGFTGLTLITDADLSYGDRTLNDLGVMLSYDSGGFRIGGHLKVPLDDEVNDFLNYTLGVHAGFVL